MKAIVLGGTKGLGKAIADNLKSVCDEIVAAGSKDIDTSSLDSVKNFTKKHSETDVLVLNTGGPPDLKFEEINDKIWVENFNKLFLSFTNLKKKKSKKIKTLLFTFNYDSRRYVDRIRMCG